MVDSVNNLIPFVPENTTDPAAGLNLSIKIIDALLQLAVLTVNGNTPPGSPANGDRHIVGTAPTGAWAGQAGKMAQRLDGVWVFRPARIALNLADSQMYTRVSTTWAPMAGGLPADGTITNAKLANMATKTYKGRSVAGTGVPSDVPVATLKADLAIVSADVTGTATNDNAAAGKIGQYIEGVLASGSALSVTSATALDITSISLTAGDWEVSGSVVFIPVAGTSITLLACGPSDTSATFDADNSKRVQMATAAQVPGTALSVQHFSPIRYSLAATTTIYLVARAIFTVSTLTAYGTIRARRMR